MAIIVRKCWWGGYHNNVGEIGEDVLLLLATATGVSDLIMMLVMMMMLMTMTMVW